MYGKITYSGENCICLVERPYHSDNDILVVKWSFSVKMIIYWWYDPYYGIISEYGVTTYFWWKWDMFGKINDILVVKWSLF